MVLKLIVCVALISAFPYVTFSQASNDLAQKRESLLELETDYGILKVRFQNNRNEYSIQPFCNVKLTEPALSARKNYCNQKATEFTSKDADLRGQMEKLTESIQQLNKEINQLQSQSHHDGK